MEKSSGKCIVVCAPSGAGKTTVVRHLINEIPNLGFSVSATSRSPREGEVDGVHYHFLTAEEFKKKVKNSEFLEWEEVYPDQFYGTLKSEIERLWEQGCHVIFDVDVEGGVNLKKAFGEKALGIFIQPPSLEELEKRLRKRNTETEESLQKRLSKASHEMNYADKFDWILVNDNLETTRSAALQGVKSFLDE